jgi:hypothetical protein
METESGRPEATTSEQEDRGLVVSEQQSDDAQEIQKAVVSRREESIMRDALAFLKTSDAKWADARGQGGPSPSDFGEHLPIPIDAVCLSPVLALDEAVVEDVPETVEELEQDLRSKRSKTNG